MMSENSRRGVFCSVGILGLACIISGCDRDTIHSYRVPKSQDSAADSGMLGMPGPSLSPGASSGANVVWTVPPGWNEVHSEQTMRVATFQAAGSEVTVAAFPGAVGGNLANVNRWRSQIGLDPIGEPELAKLLVSSQEGKTQVFLLSLTGSEGQVMLAAIVLPGDDKTWFVKSVTDASKAAALKTDFEKFSKSFHLESSSSPPPTAPLPGSAASAGTSPSAPTIPNTVPINSAPAGEIDARLAKWTPPSHWKAETQSGGILAAAYAATNSEGGARATVTSLLGDGGGLKANINRWRDQLGLAALTDRSGPPVSSIGGGTTLVDLTNAAGTDRMISVIVPAGQSTWFFKLRGSVKGVEAEKEAFVKFVKAMVLGT